MGVCMHVECGSVGHLGHVGGTGVNVTVHVEQKEWCSQGHLKSNIHSNALQGRDDAIVKLAVYRD